MAIQTFLPGGEVYEGRREQVDHTSAVLHRRSRTPSVPSSGRWAETSLEDGDGTLSETLSAGAGNRANQRVEEGFGVTTVGDVEAAEG